MFLSEIPKALFVVVIVGIHDQDLDGELSVGLHSENMFAESTFTFKAGTWSRFVSEILNTFF